MRDRGHGYAPTIVAGTSMRLIATGLTAALAASVVVGTYVVLFR